MDLSDISPRMRVRLLAIGAAALIVGLGYWYFHRNGSSSTTAASTANNAAPTDPLTSAIDSLTGQPGNGTTASTTALPGGTSHSAPGLGSTVPASAPKATVPVMGPPTFTGPFVPPATPGAPTQSAVKNGVYNPGRGHANPSQPAGSTQGNLLSDIGGSIARLSTDFAYMAPLGLLALPAESLVTAYNYAGGYQGLNQDLWNLGYSPAGQAIGGAVISADNAINNGIGGGIGGLGNAIAGTWNAITGYTPPSSKKAYAAAAPARVVPIGGTPNSATAASQLAHRGKPAPKTPIAAPAATRSLPPTVARVAQRLNRFN